MKLPKKKPKKLSYYKKKLDKLFSEYIRRKDADKEGYANCYTCGARHHWKKLQNGHYVRRSAGLSVYFLEDNCKPCCYACNILRDGNIDEYTLHLIKDFGQGILEELNSHKYKVVKYSIQDYEELIGYYTQLIDKLPKTHL